MMYCFAYIWSFTCLFLFQMGVSNGVVEYLFIRLSGYIMKQVGMAPGGEFRAAVQMLSLQVHRHLILGDRPIGITLQRAMDSLGMWKKIKFFFSLLFGFVEIRQVPSRLNWDNLSIKVINKAAFSCTWREI